MEITAFSEKLEAVIAKNNGIIKNEADRLVADLAISSTEEIKNSLKDFAEQNRLLKIGIIGRVKAGKSSLLNAIFFEGKAILPKAATPMTAALTTISYAEKLSAEVEFFSQQDIANIKSQHATYEQDLEKLIKSKQAQFKDRQNKRTVIEIAKALTGLSKEQREKIKSQAIRELKENVSLSAAHDQYQRMQQSGIDSATLASNQLLEVKTLADLKDSLLAYVGADGQYMPFTKSVHIKIPEQSLKGIEIIDTPGVNDPVQSREKRTRELLKSCDVVLIVSPSGQFLSAEDIDLMDRVTAKEGVRELYVVPSKIDDQLFGNEYKENAGNLHQALDSIRLTLAAHLKTVLLKLKETNPEIGTAYDQLIEQSQEKIIHSSGICPSIKLNFDHQTNWDSGTQTAWGNLVKYYPDYFSDSDSTLSFSNLDKLANTSEINNIITTVKQKKTDILKARQDDFIKAKSKMLEQYKGNLITYIDEQKQNIENSDLEELAEKQKKLTHIKTTVSGDLNEEYYALVAELENKIKNELDNTLNGYFRESSQSVADAEGSETKSWEVSTSNWYNPFSWGDTETRTRTYATARTGAVRNALETLTSEIEDKVDTQSKAFIITWKKSLHSQLLSTLRAKVADDDLDPSKIRKVIRHVFNSIVYPEIAYSGELPSNLAHSRGTLKKSEAEEFLADAQNYISTLRRRVKADIKTYVTALTTALNELDIANNIFADYTAILQELAEQIANKELTIDRFNRLQQQLKSID